jgi:hypothetical protein
MRSRKRSRPREPKPDRREAIQRVAETVVGSHRKGKRPYQDEVALPRGPWTLRLDGYYQSTGQAAIPFTRARAYFGGWRGLELSVRKRARFDALWEGLGFGSRPPLGSALNDRFVIRGKPEARLPSLFSRSALSQAMCALPSMRLSVKRPSRKSRRRYGEDAGVVVCLTSGFTTDVGRMVAMLEVVGETLDALARVGEASEHPVE